MSDPTCYTHTYNFFKKARSYRLTGSALTWMDEGEAGVKSLPYSDIKEVRLAYRPTRVQRNRYFAHIVPKSGKQIDITNTSFRGLGDLVEHNEAYSAFIRELHRRLVTMRTDATFHKGSSMLGYIGNMLLTIFIVAMVVLAFFLLTATGVVWIAVVKLAIIAFFVPTLYRFMKRSRPQDYDPRDIPDDALPA